MVKSIICKDFEIFVDPNYCAYNVIEIFGDFEIIEEPIEFKNDTLSIGDKITEISGKETSAHYTPFKLKEGFIKYVGKLNALDERGNLTYLLFTYSEWNNLTFKKRMKNNKSIIFVCWLLLSDNELFYEIRNMNARSIIPTKIVRFKNGEK